MTAFIVRTYKIAFCRQSTIDTRRQEYYNQGSKINQRFYTISTMNEKGIIIMAFKLGLINVGQGPRIDNRSFVRNYFKAQGVDVEILEHASYEDLIDQGFVTEAVINYVALLGWHCRLPHAVFLH